MERLPENRFGGKYESYRGAEVDGQTTRFGVEIVLILTCPILVDFALEAFVKGSLCFWKDLQCFENQLTKPDRYRKPTHLIRFLT